MAAQKSKSSSSPGGGSKVRKHVSVEVRESSSRSKSGSSSSRSIGSNGRRSSSRSRSKQQFDDYAVGQPDIDSVSGSERKNLPETVEPGVTYRDVLVGWRAAAKLDPKQGDDDG
jgi:hypothetical protein